MVVICSLSPQRTACGTWHSFRAFGVCWTRLSLSPPLDLQAWSPVPQPQGWASVESLPTWTLVLTEKSCLSHYQFPSPPSLCFDAFSCTSKALTLRSLIKKIKRNFAKLNQNQIYKIKDCRIRNSGWKGESLKCSIHGKEIQFSLCTWDVNFQFCVMEGGTQIPLKLLGARHLIALGHFKNLSHAY